MAAGGDGRAQRAGAGRRLGLVALFALLVLAPIVVRVAVDGRAELAAAIEVEARADVDAQIRHLGRAARWRLPLARHDDEARAALRALAEAAEARDDAAVGLAAWRELRRALIGTRVVTVVDADGLDAANAAIVRLMVREAEVAGRASDPARWAAELEEDLAPRGRSLLASACFLAWLIACVGFFVAGIDGKGRLQPRGALRWGGAALATLLAWILLI